MAKEKGLKDIDNIGLFIGYLKIRLKHSNFKSKKGLSNKLGGLISQYRTQFNTNPFEDFLNFSAKKLGTTVKTTTEEDNGYVYFIGNLQNKVVKIGFSKKPNKRLKQLQTGSPLKLKVIYKTKGSKLKEADLQKKFSKQRTQGEWFSISGELKETLLDLGVNL